MEPDSWKLHQFLPQTKLTSRGIKRSMNDPIYLIQKILDKVYSTGFLVKIQGTLFFSSAYNLLTILECKTTLVNL